MIVKVVIKESDFDQSKYSKKEWEKSVEIVRWEHNYEEKKYIIEYKEKPTI